MKKNLAKKVTLSILAGAMLMSSSVAWAADPLTVVEHEGAKSILITSVGGHAYMANSIFIGNNGGVGTMNGDVIYENTGVNGVAIGAEAAVIANGGVALGANTKVETTGSVALGIGSAVNEGDSSYVVSVGSGVNGEDYATRSIINVTDVSDWKTNDSKGSYAVNVNTLKEAVASVESQIRDVSDSLSSSYCTSGQVNTLVEEVDDKIGSITDFAFPTREYIREATTLADAAIKLDSAVSKKADKSYVDDNFVRIGGTAENQPQISIDSDGQMVFGPTSSWIDGDGEGFFAGRINDGPNDGHTADNARSSIMSDGSIKGASGKFKVDGATGNVTAANLYNKDEVDAKLNDKADKTALEEETSQRKAEDLKLKQQIAELGGGNSEAINAINQRLDKTNAKINKVGAGAAALAALHPLDYDPDDKLTFSAGMGNYAGENAAALGAFYRPNEKFMVSLGGTMGNGENMVNLGISIGLDKANGFAKMSKRELIQEVNAVKAENEAIKADNEAMKAEMAEMKAMLQELLAKK